MDYLAGDFTSPEAHNDKAAFLSSRLFVHFMPGTSKASQPVEYLQLGQVIINLVLMYGIFQCDTLIMSAEKLPGCTPLLKEGIQSMLPLFTS
jgi:hypothetical protein